jgi:hypothetical protein
MLSNVKQEWESIISLKRDGLQILVDCYFLHFSRDVDEYHLSQCALHVVAKAIRSMSNNEFGFVIRCYKSLLIDEDSLLHTFRYIKSHVFLINAFAAVDSGYSNDCWKQQFQETIYIFQMLTIVNAMKPIVVLLRSLSDPTTARRLRDLIQWIASSTAVKGGLQAINFACMDCLHDHVPLAEPVSVPTAELLEYVAQRCYILFPPSTWYNEY